MSNPVIDQVYWQLAEKMLNGTITAEEQFIFNEWYNKSQDETIEMPAGFATGEIELKQRILTTINNRKKAPGSSRSRVYQYLAAASIIFFVSIAGMHFSHHKFSQPKIVQATPVHPTAKEIKPGTNKAILSLADGTQIVLDSVANGKVSNQGSALITKIDDKLTYKSGKTRGDEIVINTISTPKGGQYQVMLSDGTVVWLNAASALAFPVTFNGKERKVQLKGEAYFEVAKNAALPFIVELNDLNIAVLGTHFNVKAYDDESNVKTTLLEGSVKLSRQNNSVILRSGQEARTNGTSQLKVLDNVDVNQAVAWKSGLFEFDGPIRDIMKQISRWYDVDVIYEGKITDRSFAGTIARGENISGVLQLLEMTGSIHFKVEGRNVRVMP